MKKRSYPPKKPSHKQKPDLSILAASWPSPYVAREKIEEFTGGLITSKTMANLDSLGEGPEGRITCGRKVAYAVLPYIEWLEERSTTEAQAEVAAWK